MLTWLLVTWNSHQWPMNNAGCWLMLLQISHFSSPPPRLSCLCYTIAYERFKLQQIPRKNMIPRNEKHPPFPAMHVSCEQLITCQVGAAIEGGAEKGLWKNWEISFPACHSGYLSSHPTGKCAQAVSPTELRSEGAASACTQESSADSQHAGCTMAKHSQGTETPVKQISEHSDFSPWHMVHWFASSVGK